MLKRHYSFSVRLAGLCAFAWLLATLLNPVGSVLPTTTLPGYQPNVSWNSGIS
ncbi:MAG: hypothetical protein JNK29_18950 [Anaerolineales bacterium]|nr:hypothetical protein [Anaerolineales bacterium]